MTDTDLDAGLGALAQIELLARLPVSIFRSTADGRIAYANPALAEMLRYASVAELLEVPVADLYAHPADRSMLIGRLAASQGEPLSVELEQRRKDGSPLWGRVTVVPVYGERGELRYIEGVVEDITDRRRAQAALQHSEELFRTAFEDAPQGLAIIGADLIVQQVNRSFAGMIGRTVEEVLHEDARAFIHPDDLGAADANAAEILRGGSASYQVERRMQHKDGHEIPVLIAGAPVRSPDGELLAIVSQVFDISDRVRAERALADSEELFRSIFHGSPIPISLRGADMTFERANPAMQRLMRLDAAEMRNLDLRTALDDEGMAEIAAGFARLASGGPGLDSAEMRVRRGDGTSFWALVSMSAIRAHSGEPRAVISHLVDITERKQAEERLRELVHSRKELIASVSHELRTPLTTIVGLAQELRDRAGDFSAAERADLIALIAGQAEEMVDLINDLLVASHEASGMVEVHVQPVDLAAEVRSVLRSAAHDAALIGGALDVKCQADPFRLRQILRNLLSNAAKYGTPPVRLELDATSEACVVRARDGGPGLPPDQWEAIFERYYRAHQPDALPGAVGLGLSLSRDLARAMGGDLVYRVEDGTSVFELTLPRCAPA